MIRENLRPGLNGIVTISQALERLIQRPGENLRPGLNGIVTSSPDSPRPTHAQE